MGRAAAVELRDARSDADVGVWVSVYNETSPCRREGPLSVRHAWDAAEEWWAVVAWSGGRPVGVAHVTLQDWSPGSLHAEVTVAVPAGERGRGVGTALYRAVSGWAADRGQEGLDVWFDVAAADAMRYWRRRGYVEVGRERISLLDLREPPRREEPAPAGIRFVTLADAAGCEEGLYRVACEGMADIPSIDPYDAGGFADWRAVELERPGLARDCSVVAFDGDDEVVGFALLVRCEAIPGMAEHELTAVARACRGRGLAGAMKGRQIAFARAAGLTLLEAANEERNAPMLAVNARLGYRPETAHVQMRGPLAG